MNRNSLMKHLDFIIIDCFSIVLSLLFASLLRFGNLEKLFTSDYIRLLITMIVANVFVIVIYEPYKGILRRGNLSEAKKIIIQFILNFLLITFFLFSVKNSSIYSRIVIYSTYIINVILVYVFRIIRKIAIIKKSKIALKKGTKSLIILAYEKNIKETIKQIESTNYNYYRISGVCVVDKKLKEETINGYKVIANIDDILDYISKNWIDEVYLACDYQELSEKVKNGFIEARLPIKIKISDILPVSTKYIVEKSNNEYYLSTNIHVMSNLQLIIKRLMDIVGGIVGCLFTLILIIIIGPIIYIKSPGNIFYVSKRVGKNGRVFNFYKFRSMVLNADDVKKELLENNRVKDGMMFKMDNDPRIIQGIGSFIRKTSLDEFPQFFNVLKGDMSLVGTRPPTLDEWNRYSPYYRSRLSIKPGITGMWQVSGRSSIVDFNEVVKLDNEYINNASILLDIKILFKTVISIFRSEDEAL